MLNIQFVDGTLGYFGPVTAGSFLPMKEILAVKVKTFSIVEEGLICISVNQASTMQGMVQAAYFMLNLVNRFSFPVTDHFESVLVCI